MGTSSDAYELNHECAICFFITHSIYWYYVAGEYNSALV